MSKALTPSKPRAAVLMLAFVAVLAAAAFASTARAATVHLRIEGADKTQFNGDVTTSARSVPGGTDSPICRADANPATFASANGLTAVADALGDANISTSGTFFGWGTQLCSVNGEFAADKNGGWLVRINQQDPTSPNGYVLATDPLSNGDSELIYLSPSYGYFSASLELRLPADAKPGVPVTGYVDSFDTATDAKSPGAGAAISGGGASATSGSDGSFTIVFPSAGRFLVNASKSGAIRGSQWVTVAEDATTTPVTPISQKQINKQRRVAARAKCRASFPSKKGEDYTRCIRTANNLGRTLSAKEKRIAAREKCVKLYPQRGTASRVKCVRAANAIGS